jgi:hypothetical protein
MYYKIIVFIMDMAILKNCPCYSVVYFWRRYFSVSETETTTSDQQLRVKIYASRISFFFLVFIQEITPEVQVLDRIITYMERA